MAYGYNYGYGGYPYNYGSFGGYGGFGGFGFGNETAQFLSTLSPGVRVSLQYDCQPPAFGVFQGFQGGNILLSNYNGFPGLVRIAANRVNAVSPFS